MHCERRVERDEEAQHVVEVAQEEELGARAVRGGDHLREVNDRGAIGGEQDVVGRQIAVDQIAAQHRDDLRQQICVDPHRIVGWDRDVDHARRDLPIGTGDQLHQEDALVEHHRGRDAHAAAGQLVEGVGLGGFPGLFLGVAPELAAAIDRALGASIADLAAFLVVRVVLEAAGRAVLVDLRRENRVPTANGRDIGFLATLQATADLVDDSFSQQEIEIGHFRSGM